MNKVTKKELENWTPINSKVLIKLDRNNDEIKLSTGDKLYLDTSYGRERHAPVTGTVTAVPRSLNCRKNMDWETPMELAPGWRVWWNYVDTLNALDNESTAIDEDGNIHVMLPYQSCVVAKDLSGNIVTLNGYMLCSPVEDEKISSKLIHIPDHIRKNKSAKFAILRHQGTKNGWYRRPEYHDHIESVPNGSVIVFSKHSDIPLEYDLHSEFEGKETLYKMQWPDILAVIPDYNHESYKGQKGY